MRPIEASEVAHSISRLLSHQRRSASGVNRAVLQGKGSGRSMFSKLLVGAGIGAAVMLITRLVQGRYGAPLSRIV